MQSLVRHGRLEVVVINCPDLPAEFLSHFLTINEGSEVIVCGWVGEDFSIRKHGFDMSGNTGTD